MKTSKNDLLSTTREIAARFGLRASGFGLRASGFGQIIC